MALPVHKNPKARNGQWCSKIGKLSKIHKIGGKFGKKIDKISKIGQINKNIQTFKSRLHLPGPVLLNFQLL